MQWGPSQIACGNDEQCRRGVEGDLRDSIFCDVANGLVLNAKSAQTSAAIQIILRRTGSFAATTIDARVPREREECPDGKFCVLVLLECDIRDGRGCAMTVTPPSQRGGNLRRMYRGCRVSTRQPRSPRSVRGRREVCDTSDNAGCTVPGAQVCNEMTGCVAPAPTTPNVSVALTCCRRTRCV